MPYLRVMFDNEEIDRRDIDGPVVIGRCSQCELAVRDILLSRSHCRIEPGPKGTWQAIDLNSKNGTLLNNEALTAACELADGDMLRLGRVRVKFMVGRLADAGLTAMRAPPLRPADPHESMAGTYTGFAFLEPGELAQANPGVAPNYNAPRPHPAPRLPAAFDREDIYSLLASIASSSWDSIYAEARRPLPGGAAVSEDWPGASRPRQRPRSPIDLSLQVCQRTELPGVRTRGVRSSRVQRFKRFSGQAAIWLVLLTAVILKCFFDGSADLSGPAVAQAAQIATQIGTQTGTPAVTAQPGDGTVPADATPAQIVAHAAAGLLPFVL